MNVGVKVRPIVYELDVSAASCGLPPASCVTCCAMVSGIVPLLYWAAVTPVFRH